MDINECSFSVLLKLYMSEYSKVTGKKYSQGLIAECINVSRKDFCISINKDIEEMSSRVLYGLYGYISIFMNLHNYENVNGITFLSKAYTRILQDIEFELKHRQSNREFVNSHMPPKQR